MKKFWVLLTLTRAGQDLDNVKVLEWWPYRKGRLTSADVDIDVWNSRKANNSLATASSLALQYKVAKECGCRIDNHACGVIEYKGKVLSIRWSDCNTQCGFGHLVVASEAPEGYYPATPNRKEKGWR